MGRGAASCFPHGDPNAGQEELDIVLSEAAHGGHAAPDRQGQGHDGAPRALVREAGDGNAEAHVEDGEGKAREQAELLIGKAHLRFDRFLKNDQQLPVDEVEGIDHGEEGEHPPAVGGALVGAGAEDRHG